jgi:hypothetical protein
LVEGGGGEGFAGELYLFASGERFFQVCADIHPAYGSVRLADYQHYRICLFLPVFFQANILDGEDLFVIPLAFVEVGVPGFKL